MSYPASVVRLALNLLNEGTSSTKVGAELHVPPQTIRKWRQRNTTDPSWPRDEPPCAANIHGASHYAYARGCRCPEARAAKREWQRAYDKSRMLRIDRLVPKIETERRIAGLMRMGWTSRHIAQAGGISHQTLSSLYRQQWVTVEVRDAVRRASRVLFAVGQGPSNHTRRRAMKAGFAPLAAWDDHSITDPDAEPEGVAFTGGRRRVLPDPELLAAEVNRAGVKAVARKYEVNDRSVSKALARGGYRAVGRQGNRYDRPTYMRKEAA